MGWQPIETAPEVGVFLAYDKNIGVCYAERFYSGKDYFSCVFEIGGGFCEYDFDDVTHWQPLPASPEA